MLLRFLAANRKTKENARNASFQIGNNLKAHKAHVKQRRTRWKPNSGKTYALIELPSVLICSCVCPPLVFGVHTDFGLEEGGSILGIFKSLGDSRFAHQYFQLNCALSSQYGGQTIQNHWFNLQLLFPQLALISVLSLILWSNSPGTFQWEPCN